MNYIYGYKKKFQIKFLYHWIISWEIVSNNKDNQNVEEGKNVSFQIKSQRIL